MSQALIEAHISAACFKAPLPPPSSPTAKLNFRSAVPVNIPNNNTTRGGGVLDPWLGVGVPLRVSNPDPV